MHLYVEPQLRRLATQAVMFIFPRFFKNESAFSSRFYITQGTAACIYEDRNGQVTLRYRFRKQTKVYMRINGHILEVRAVRTVSDFDFEHLGRMGITA